MTEQRAHFRQVDPHFPDAAFADVITSNHDYVKDFQDSHLTGRAAKELAVVTCMDSRLQPLEMLGLFLGEAKILRTPGGHVTQDALNGCILGVHLLRVDRILVIAHTKCAMASGDDDEIRRRVASASGLDVSDLSVGATPDQSGKLRADVALLADHPLIAGRAEIGGFIYDVDKGLLAQVC